MVPLAVINHNHYNTKYLINRWERRTLIKYLENSDFTSRFSYFLNKDSFTIIVIVNELTEIQHMYHIKFGPSHLQSHVLFNQTKFNRCHWLWRPMSPSYSPDSHQNAPQKTETEPGPHMTHNFLTSFVLLIWLGCLLIFENSSPLDLIKSLLP